MTNFGIQFTMPFMWTVLAIVFAILEGLTLGLTTIWFAIGSVAALIVALLGGNFILQCIAFAAVSLLTLAVARPMAKNILKIGSTKTNVDSITGKTGVVHVPVQPYQVGQVKVNGQIWTAKGEDDVTDIAEGVKVEVIRVDGVKLIVKPIKEEEA